MQLIGLESYVKGLDPLNAGIENRIEFQKADSSGGRLKCSELHLKCLLLRLN